MISIQRFYCLGLLLLAPNWAAAQQPGADAKAIAFYEQQVLPLLKQECYRCHGDGKQRGGFSLQTRADVLAGGDFGPGFNIDQPEQSLLLKAVHYEQDRLKMPPSGKLSDEKIAILSRWVKLGIPFPADAQGNAKPRERASGITAKDRAYWAYQPVRRPDPPKVDHPDWVRTPIDALVLARLEANGLKPTTPADRATLVRRAHFDLTGLPPTPAEVDAFVKDDSPDAYERLIDRLLDSPHYGEKWGRHWLDLVRYAESHGYERDNPKPFAWRYRDYVINAFNQDKPYDQFLREQLAGDELDKVTPETMIATGYYRLNIWDDEPADRLLAKYDVLDGILSTTSQVFMGMTINCARCHDHKKDPIPQRDYYRMLAFFHDITPMNQKNTRMVSTAADRKEHARLLQAKQDREAKIYQQIYTFEQEFTRKLQQSKKIRGSNLPKPDLTDLSFKFYRNTFEQLPDFALFKPETEGTIAGNFLTLRPASREQAIGLVYQAKLKVPHAGAYTFDLNSTEGARLTIDDKVILDRPKPGRHQVAVTVELPAGLLPFRLEYFNGNQKPQLKLTWSSPGGEKRFLTEDPTWQMGHALIPDARQQAQSWRFLLRNPPKNWMRPDFNATNWRQGKAGFGSDDKAAPNHTRWRSRDIWLRKSIELGELPNELAITLRHSGPIDIYLNGQSVYTDKKPQPNYRQVFLPAMVVQRLQPGPNVLAVHCSTQRGEHFVDVGLNDGQLPPSLPELIREHGPGMVGQEEIERYTRLGNELKESRKREVPVPGIEVMCVEERGRSDTFVLLRGSPQARGDQVTPGVPEVLPEAPLAMEQRPAEAAPSGKRLALANWLTHPKHPLTSRVMANRLWQYHFGRGIVPTPSDFGKLGEKPTHPKLLDWLASELVRGGWKLKRMHKLIMMSNTYRMSSKAYEEALEEDAANSLFWRYNMRRLTAEEIRDSILAVSGRLNLKAGGPSIYPPIPKAVLAGQSRPGSGWHTSDPEESSRRSVYIHVKRSLLVPILSQHDVADTDSSCPVRYTTTVPTQSLGMLNGDFTNEQARFFAERLKREAHDNLTAQVRRAIRLTTGRAATDQEVQADLAFIKALQTTEKLGADEALRVYCLLQLNTNEFVYLD